MVMVCLLCPPARRRYGWDRYGIRHSLAIRPFWHFVKVGSPGSPVPAVSGPVRTPSLAWCAHH